MRTRPQFWLALITAICGSGVWKVVDASASIIDRLARLEVQVAAMHQTVDAMERREERRQ